jgi:hypothetical protein
MQSQLAHQEKVVYELTCTGPPFVFADCSQQGPIGLAFVQSAANVTAGLGGTFYLGRTIKVPFLVLSHE